MATIHEALTVAIQHHQGGRLQPAEQIYRQILAADPNQADALHLLGVLAHQAGQHDDAVDCISKAIGLQGCAAAYHINLGEAHRALGRISAAVACYRRAIELNPNYAEAHNNLGIALREQGRPEEALACWRRAIELNPNFAAAHNNLANAFKDQGRLDEAVACWQRALELNPGYAEAHSNLGVALREQGKLEQAINCWRRAVELRPDYADAYSNLGNAARDQGKPDEATAFYRHALQLKPDFAEAHGNLGNALRDQGDLDAAVASYRRAIELKPGMAELHKNLGSALKDQGRLDEAIAAYRRAVDLKPNYAQARSNLGVAFKEQAKAGEAIACWRRALEFDPKLAEACNNLGAVLREQRKLGEAASYCRRALDLQPDFAEAHVNLGNALRDMGRLDDALDCYRRAIELKPAYAEAFSNRGNALKDQGKQDEALDCYRRAIELKPNLAEAHGNLGSALEEMGDLRAAEKSFRAAFGHNRRSALAHYKLAELLGKNLPGADIAAQHRLLEEAGLSPAQRSLLHFGLAQVLDAKGEYAEAAVHLDRGNALQLVDWRNCDCEYDPQAHASLVSEMIAACSPDLFERAYSFGAESDVPVFIVGLPRSGTTLTEQILAGHSQVFAAGEIKLARETMSSLGSQCGDTFEGLRQMTAETARRAAIEHLEKLRALNRTALRIVDKMPENYLFLGLLASLFPRAKFIHCRRNLRDTAVSCWITNFQDVRWANDQRHIASRFRDYRRIMEHWRNVLPVPLLEVDYEETVADLEGAARNLVEWCGLAWEPACLDFQRAKRAVKTASAVQVRKPIFTTSLDRWKHYEHSLGTLFAELDDAAACESASR